ncbi:TIGR03086 family metal-binding protein [Nonomuraea sp. NPDC001023]|uniref:TIGR03086 family metal-binding protein n=1 Tax=unclassified Nonomuraea TaxID=2593643 RepID=UPI00332E17BD
MDERARALTAGVALLERAIHYTLGSLRVVSPHVLCRPTPCSRWNLQELLDHMQDSFEALNEAALGRIATARRPVPVGGPASGNPALLLRDGATEVLDTWTGTIRAGMIAVGNVPMTTPMVAAAGAIEITVHGWDIARACGERRPIPHALAEELLDLAQLFVTDEDRPFRFAARLRPPPLGTAQDHLLAYLGRDPN